MAEVMCIHCHKLTPVNHEITFVNYNRYPVYVTDTPHDLPSGILVKPGHTLTMPAEYFEQVKVIVAKSKIPKEG
jgi:hypothetical protein